MTSHVEYLALRYPLPLHNQYNMVLPISSYPKKYIPYPSKEKSILGISTDFPAVVSPRSNLLWRHFCPRGVDPDAKPADFLNNHEVGAVVVVNANVRFPLGVSITSWGVLHPLERAIVECLAGTPLY